MCHTLILTVLKVIRGFVFIGTGSILEAFTGPVRKQNVLQTSRNDVEMSHKVIIGSTALAPEDGSLREYRAIFREGCQVAAVVRSKVDPQSKDG